MLFRREHAAANVATVVERTTRYTVLFRNSDRRSKPIMSRLIDEFGPLPVGARCSVTVGGGLEFVSRAASSTPASAPRPGFATPRRPGRAHGREHQRSAPASSAARHRRAAVVGPGPGVDPRPPQRQAPQVPRMAHPRRGLPRPPHGGVLIHLIPCPRSPSHFAWNSHALVNMSFHSSRCQKRSISSSPANDLEQRKHLAWLAASPDETKALVSQAPPVRPRPTDHPPGGKKTGRLSAPPMGFGPAARLGRQAM